MERLNQMSEEDFGASMLRCCGSSLWVQRMLSQRPFASMMHLSACADWCWWTLPESEWRAAFLAHPRIGGNIDSLREKFKGYGASAPSPSWEGEEQSGTKYADEDVLRGLSDGNEEYETHFGHVFLICATGKSAQEMLVALQARKHNTPQQEFLIAAGEQAKIAQLRIGKIISALEIPRGRL
jgi:2-oxo-4-hydroxy-4-carboxy-5-ureidoimidazoline decarboxylase